MVLLAVPSSERKGAGPLPAGSDPTQAAHRLVRVSRQQRPRLSLAARREGEGPLPARPCLARAAQRLSVCSCRGAVGCAEQARGREQGPFPPGLARLGPRTACACVAAPSLSAVPSSERGSGGACPPPLQGLVWLGQSTLCWCCCPFTVCSADQWREYCDACSQALSWGVVCLSAAQHLDLMCLTVLGSNQHKAHQCQSNSLNCWNSKAILL